MLGSIRKAVANAGDAIQSPKADAQHVSRSDRLRRPLTFASGPFFPSHIKAQQPMNARPLVLALLLSGCMYFEYSTNPVEIVAFAREKQSQGAVQNLLWYRGREGDFDYFKYVYSMFSERRFRVPVGAIPVPQDLKLTDDSNQWVAVPSIGNEWKFYVPQQQLSK